MKGLKLVPTTPEDYEALTRMSFAETAFQCHGASLALVKALGHGRVARGHCEGVDAQHSWVVLGDDCYDPEARIVDPSLWSWLDQEPNVWIGLACDRPHIPQGAGSIWDYGKPPPPTGKIIELAVDPGPEAKVFLDIAAPDGLDQDGWSVLLHSPVGGWPAAAIIDAAAQTRPISADIPIDVLGMLTDRNPQGLYR